MKVIINTVIFFFISCQLIADEAPYDMHELLLHYNLAAHVKISRHGQGYFRVKVIDVLDKRKSGIVEGDYLKVNYDFNLVCPAAFPLEYAQDHREALAFLSYVNGQWSLTQGEIAFLEAGLASIKFDQEGYVYKAPIAEWKVSLKEYANNFSEDSEGKLVLKLNKEQVKSEPLEALTHLQYASYYYEENQRLSRYKHLHLCDFPELLEEETDLVLDSDLNMIHTIAAVYPISDSMALLINKHLTQIIEKEHLELQERGVKGKSIYSLTIEKDGKISEVEILRSIAPEVNREIETYFTTYNQWKPALNEKGKAIRFRQTLVFMMK